MQQRLAESAKRGHLKVQKLINIAHNAFRKLGFDIHKYKPQINRLELRRAFIFDYFNISFVIDVGANVGNYVTEIRSQNYNGTIISFEPLSREFKILAERAKNDHKWECFQYAIGDYDGKVIINISNHSASSSILPITDIHRSAAPDSYYVGTEEVEIHRLDTLFNSKKNPHNDRVFLKIDVQGFEKNVLNGCGDFLNNIYAIEIELSLQEVYRGDMIYYEMINYLEEMGFRMVSWEDVLYDNKTQYILQADAIFIKIIG